MWIIEFLKKLLVGRGFYPSLMVIFSWSYTVVLTVALVWQIFLYIFKVKYYNQDFKNEVNKKENKASERSDEDSV